MKAIARCFLTMGFWAVCGMATAQENLLDLLGPVETPDAPVTATFKDTRIINGQSNETPAGGVLHFVIAHRFGQISDGAYDLWGLDNASMRMGFDYGITDRLAVGVARNTFQKTYEANLKARLVRQSNTVPLSITGFSALACNGLRWTEPDRDNFFSSRLSYTHQLVIARKFSSKLSAALTPSVVHHNLVATPDEAHDEFLIGAGGRYKLSQRVSVNGEYFLRLNPNEAYNNSLSLGVDIETGGHVFQLHVTNSRGMFERAFLTETAGKWSDGNIYFGFNLSRVFTVSDR
jgi:hypothetical protein